MSDDLHDLGCPYGEITADDIYEHVGWLEERAREQVLAKHRPIAEAAANVHRAAMSTADLIHMLEAARGLAPLLEATGYLPSRGEERERRSPGDLRRSVAVARKQVVLPTWIERENGGGEL